MSADPKTFREYAHDSWRAHYKSEVVPWDTGHWKALCDSAKLLASNEHARGVWSTYLMNCEPFFAGHCPRKFKQNLSRFVADHASIKELPVTAYRREIGPAEQANINKILDDRAKSRGVADTVAVTAPLSTKDRLTDDERESARKALREIRKGMRR